MAPAEPLSFAAAAQNKVLDGADGKRRKFSCSPSPPPHPCPSLPCCVGKGHAAEDGAARRAGYPEAGEALPGM